MAFPVGRPLQPRPAPTQDLAVAGGAEQRDAWRADERGLRASGAGPLMTQERRTRLAPAARPVPSPGFEPKVTCPRRSLQVQVLAQDRETKLGPVHGSVLCLASRGRSPLSSKAPEGPPFPPGEGGRAVAPGGGSAPSERTGSRKRDGLVLPPPLISVIYGTRGDASLSNEMPMTLNPGALLPR